MAKVESINFSKTNPNLDKLQEHFNRALDKYFDPAGKPKPECFEAIGCYHCQKREVVSEFVVERFRHVRCAHCGMVYVSPRLKAQMVHDSYNEKHYDDFYRIKLIPAVDYRREVIARRKYRQIMPYFHKPGKILDIGCGLGEFLSVFKEEGWDCLGVEFNEFAASYGKEHFGVNIIAKSIFDFDAEGGQFDCVTLWGVLEHFTSPQDVLKKVYEIIRPGGYLVLEVPSGDSVLVRFVEKFGGPVDRIIEGDRHNMLFSLKAFREMISACGFVPEHIQTNGLDIKTLTRLHGKKVDEEFVDQLQDAVDRSMAGDLIRGIWKKPAK